MEYALAFALSRSGERDAAVEMQRRTLATRSAGLGPNHPDTVSATYWLAHFFQQAGRLDEADRHARQAVAIAVAHVDERHPSYARSFEMLGLVLSRSGRAEEAVPYLSRALEVKKRHSADLFLGYAQHNLATIMLDLERYGDSRAMLAEAAATMRSKEGAGSTQALGSLAYAGQAALALGETGKAEGELADVLGAMRAAEVADTALLQRAWVPLVLVRIDAGKAAEAASLAQDWTAKLRGNDKAAQTQAAQALALQALAEAADAPRARAAGEHLLDRLATARLTKGNSALSFEERLSLEIVLRLAARSGDAELALRAMDFMAATKIAQSGRLLAQRLLASDAHLAAAVREMQDLALAAQARDAEVLAAWAAGKDAALPEAARDEARRKLADARRLLAERFPQWAAATASQVPTLALIREGLVRGEALVGAVPAFEGLFVLTVTRSEATIRKSAVGREAAGNLVAGIQASLAAREFDGRAAHALHQALFSPVETRALRGIDKLRVVTGGALATLPLSLLLERPVDRIGDKTPWLVRRYAMAQQAGFLPLKRPSLARASEQRFLGVGAPAGLAATTASGPAARLQQASAYFRGGEVDRSALGSLPALPGAEAELRRLSSWYGTERSTLLTGAEASEASLLGRDLKPFSLILFATHGLVGGRSEGLAESALVLSLPDSGEKDRDGLLTVSEISRMELDADWVILSACDTAAGQTLNSEAYSGLAQAFLYAGARALLVSHWPVRDDAASYLTVRTVEAARRGGGKARRRQGAGAAQGPAFADGRPLAARCRPAACLGALRPAGRLNRPKPWA